MFWIFLLKKYVGFINFFHCLDFFMVLDFFWILSFYYFIILFFGFGLCICGCRCLGLGLCICLYLKFGPDFWFYLKIKLRLYGWVRVAGYECEANKCSSLDWNRSILEKRAFELMFPVCGLISQSVYEHSWVPGTQAKHTVEPGIPPFTARSISTR